MMEAVVVELRGKSAAVLSKDGMVSKVPNKGYEIGQVIVLKPNTAGRTRLVAFAASCAAVLCLCAVGGWAYLSPYSYVSMDVNPSVEFTLNRFDRVLKVHAVNDDGKEIVDQVGLKNLSNKTIDEAMAAAVDTIRQDGFFGDKGTGGMVIATSGKDVKKAEAMAKGLEKIAKEKLAKEKVTVGAVAVGKERVEEAQTLGVTPGKLNLVEKLIASSPSPEAVKAADWLNRPVKEIMRQIKENRKGPNVPGWDDDWDDLDDAIDDMYDDDMYDDDKFDDDRFDKDDRFDDKFDDDRFDKDDRFDDKFDDDRFDKDDKFDDKFDDDRFDKDDKFDDKFDDDRFDKDDRFDDKFDNDKFDKDDKFDDDKFDDDKFDDDKFDDDKFDDDKFDKHDDDWYDKDHPKGNGNTADSVSGATPSSTPKGNNGSAKSGK